MAASIPTTVRDRSGADPAMKRTNPATAARVTEPRVPGVPKPPPAAAHRPRKGPLTSVARSPYYAGRRVG